MRKIKPYKLEVSVICEKLPYLRKALFTKIFFEIDIVVGIVPIVSVAGEFLVNTVEVASAVLFIPVEGVRIIKAELETLSSAFIRKLAAYISAEKKTEIKVK